MNASLINCLSNLKQARHHAGQANIDLYADSLLDEIDNAIKGCEDDICMEARGQNKRLRRVRLDVVA